MSLLLQGLGLPNLARPWLTKKSYKPLSRINLGTSRDVMSRDKSKMLYLYYQIVYGDQIWQGGCIKCGLSFHKFT